MTRIHTQKGAILGLFSTYRAIEYMILLGTPEAKPASDCSLNKCPCRAPLDRQ